MDRLEIDLSRTPARWTRGIKAAAGTTFGLATLCFGGIVYEFVYYGANAGSALVSIIVGVFGALNLWMGAVAMRSLSLPLIVGASVDSHGLRLRLSDGGVMQYPWNSPKTRLSVLAMKQPPTDGGPDGYLDIGRTRPFPSWPSIYLSKVEIESLLGLISASGLTVRVKNDWVKYRGPATAHQVRGGAGVLQAAGA